MYILHLVLKIMSNMAVIMYAQRLSVSQYFKLILKPTFRRHLKTIYFQSAYPISCPSCLEYLRPCDLILLKTWRYISHLLTYLLNIPHWQCAYADSGVGTETVEYIGRYAFRPVSTTETVAEASSEDEMTEKILLGQYCECYAVPTCCNSVLRTFSGQIMWQLASMKCEHIIGVPVPWVLDSI